MTGEELVAFAKSKLGVPYVYGMKGEVMTLAKYNQLKSMYGALVWDSDKNKVGKVCCDCSGLISWATGIIRNSQGYHDTALEVQPISTISEAPIGGSCVAERAYWYLYWKWGIYCRRWQCLWLPEE